MPRFCRFIFKPLKQLKGVTARFVSTATLGNMAIPAQAKLKSFEPCSTAAPMPARSAVLFETVRAERLVPEGALTEIWTSPPLPSLHVHVTSRS